MIRWLSTFLHSVHTICHRLGKGGLIKSKQPEKPLVLWGYEASPFVKVSLGDISLLACVPKPLCVMTCNTAFRSVRQPFCS